MARPRNGSDGSRAAINVGSRRAATRSAARSEYACGVPPVLSARSLEKRYGRTEALGGVDLEVGEGQLVGLLGPNGAGKSTLVKIACGLVRATGGSVEICGAPAGSPAARRVLGYLAELFRFPYWMSADELLVLHQRLTGSAGGTAERGELL